MNLPKNQENGYSEISVKATIKGVKTKLKMKDKYFIPALVFILLGVIIASAV